MLHQLFLAWVYTQSCSYLSPQIMLVPHNPLCGHDSYVMHYQTVFEEKLYDFGIVACSDTLIYVGIRPGVYFEFDADSFKHFIEHEACTQKSEINYILM